MYGKGIASIVFGFLTGIGLGGFGHPMIGYVVGGALVIVGIGLIVFARDERAPLPPAE